MSTKLFVGGLDWNLSESDLENHFAAYGTVTESKIVTDRETGKSRGFGFVTYETSDAAKEAIDALNGTELSGRTINVNEARERPPRSSAPRRESW